MKLTNHRNAVLAVAAFSMFGAVGRTAEAQFSQKNWRLENAGGTPQHAGARTHTRFAHGGAWADHAGDAAADRPEGPGGVPADEWERLMWRTVADLRTDVEVVRNRETRTTAGAQVGTRSTSAPVRAWIRKMSRSVTPTRVA